MYINILIYIYIYICIYIYHVTYVYIYIYILTYVPFLLSIFKSFGAVALKPEGQRRLGSEDAGLEGTLGQLAADVLLPLVD